MPGNSCRSRKRTSNEGRITTNHASKCLALRGRHDLPADTPPRQQHHIIAANEAMSQAALNEGRPGGAGNPAQVLLGADLADLRSTKAGPVGPATLGRDEAQEGLVGARSTKAGPVGPATPNFTRSIVRVSSRAQRRPARWGRQPLAYRKGAFGPLGAQRRPARWGRQPDDVAERPFRLDARSTKAGPVGPATRPNRRPGARAGGRRSTKAGPVGPATQPTSRGLAAPPSALNEGRPGGAGNPLAVLVAIMPVLVRSTKAGPVGPATRTKSSRSRSMPFNAQRRPARWGRQPPPRLVRGRPASCGALNEGRPGGAGNPTRSVGAPPPARPLNEGRPGGAGNPSTAWNWNRSGWTALNEGRPGGAGNPEEGETTTRVTPCALNEGRPGGAGNPVRARMVVPSACGAQRRPARWGRQPWTTRPMWPWPTVAAQRRPARWGRQPRFPGDPDQLRVLNRSTKAGPVGPATLGRPRPDRSRTATAQRRPARWGRQPWSGWACST